MCHINLIRVLNSAGLLLHIWRQISFRAGQSSFYKTKTKSAGEWPVAFKPINRARVKFLIYLIGHATYVHTCNHGDSTQSFKQNQHVSRRLYNGGVHLNASGKASIFYRSVQYKSNIFAQEGTFIGISTAPCYGASPTSKQEVCKLCS
jgi:hypothetical protein